MMHSTEAKVTPRGLMLALIGTVVVLLLAFAGNAGAEVVYKTKFGTTGTGAGQFQRPSSIAINNSTGDVFVVDRNNQRIQQFSSSGAFIRMWGFDVVQSGTDDKPLADEVQKVTIAASSGTFTLSAGTPTAALPFNATAGQVEAALDATVSGGGGDVEVSGGPGNATGSSPYLITFKGTLAENDQPLLQLDGNGLGHPVGSKLTCQGRRIKELDSNGPFPDSFEYQWLANGAPIAGATSATYTTSGADAGAALQCRITALYGLVKSIATSSPYQLASPVPGTLPPIGPQSVATPEQSGSLTVGGAGGQTLTCNAGAWQNSPTSFTYQWYRSGQAIGTPTTTASTSNQYVVTAGDVGQATLFQCSVTGENTGGKSTSFSQNRTTSPEPGPPPTATPSANVTSNPESRVLAHTQGGAVFEVCKANPPSNDVCKAGVSGESLGQFHEPWGIAVDNSPGGNGAVYVVDQENYRVVKFSTTGEPAPVLMIGKEVNKDSRGNLCTAASGNVCGAGLSNWGPETSAFGGWRDEFLQGSADNFDQYGTQIAVDNQGYVYVSDTRQRPQFVVPFDPLPRRIEKFDSAGSYVAQRLMPTFGNSNPFAISLAVNSKGEVLAVSPEPPVVELIQPGSFHVEEVKTSTSERLEIFGDGRPKHVAVDPITDKIWVLDKNINPANGSSEDVCNEENTLASNALLAYDAQGHRLDCTVPSGAGELPRGTSGLAISTTGLAFLPVGQNNEVKIFELPQEQAPEVVSEDVSAITTGSVKLETEIDPGFDETTFYFEIGTADCASNPCTKVPATDGARGLKVTPANVFTTGLKPGTKYYYRVVAENGVGTDVGPTQTFVTFPFIDLLNDHCSNALARKQTRTAGQFDCRAYELASADFTAGYDVVSDLTPGETPYQGYPDAAGRILYSVDDGGIPGTGSPTNRGPDPYVATRGADGVWRTTYVGIPADGGFSTKPFSSTLAGADAGLDAFVFSGPEICSPCFADGSAGIPVHLPNGSLVQGMVGSIPQLLAQPAGYVAKPLSDDGNHLVFGSTSQFEPQGNNNGDVTIYDRNLGAGTTQVVSMKPDESTMTGPGIGELDVSDDGSRIVVGQQVGAPDAAENRYWHPYMHLGTTKASVDLAPGAGAGVLYAGMSDDGSKVFFTTTNSLVGGDGDASADMYEAQVDSVGNVNLTLLSVGNGAGCNPAPNSAGNHWNAVGVVSAASCGAVAIAGGGGLAGGDGTVYFLSPEKIGGQGVENQPNLFAVSPGDAPDLVATLEPNNPLVLHAVADNEVHRWSDFQVTRNGGYAAFPSAQELTPPYDNAGHAMVYRYSTSAGSIVCASCISTEKSPSADASLPSRGLGLTEDGRVFFNTADTLVLRDTNEKLDAYEYKQSSDPQESGNSLISTGFSAFPSSVLTVTPDGTDVFFFTRETLVDRDINGESMKIYDSRAGGGVFVIPPPPPCAASDECHGPSSTVAPPPPIGSYKGSGGQAKPKACRKGFVRKHNKCVKKKKKTKKHHGRKAASSQGGNR